MKRISALIIFFNISFSGFVQSKTADSTLTILKNLDNELNAVDTHGVHFFFEGKLLSDLVVKNDLEFIRKLATINKDDYKIRIINQGRYLIKLYERNNDTGPVRIVEVVTQDSSIHKKIPKVNFNYLIQFNFKPNSIELEVDENGVTFYKIGDKNSHSVRESIVYFDDDFDRSIIKEARIIIDNYKISGSNKNK